MKRLLTLLLTLFVSTSLFSADEVEQKPDVRKTLKERKVEFVIYPWNEKGAFCPVIDKTAKGFVENSTEEAVWFDRGYTFTAIDYIDKDGGKDLYIFEDNGKYYGADRQKLQFDHSKDADEVTFLLSKTLIKRNTAIGYFYGTPRALMTMIFIMLAAAIVAFAYIKLKIRSLRSLFLIIIPAAILAFSIIEIVGYMKLGDKIFWWCDYDTLGFFGSLLMLIPFALLVAAQVYSIKVYEMALFDYDDNITPDTPKKISLKPAVWSLVLCIPVFLIVVFSCAGLDLQGSVIMDIAGLGSFLLTLGVGLFISFKRNVKAFGGKTGLWVSIFSIIYIIGCIISAIAMVTLIFKIIFQILVVVGAAFILMMAGSRRRIYRNGRVYEEVTRY